MDVQEAKRYSKENQEWAACDPFTLVTAARQTLHSEIQGSNPSVTKPIEELISRFEQQTRASLGAGSAVLSGSGSGSR